MCPQFLSKLFGLLVVIDVALSKPITSSKATPNTLEEFQQRDVGALQDKQIDCLTDPTYCEPDGKLEQSIYQNLRYAGLHHRQISAYLTLLRDCWLGTCDLLQTVIRGEEILNLQNPAWKSELEVPMEKKNSDSAAKSLSHNTLKSLLPQYYSKNPSKHSLMFSRHGRRFANWHSSFVHPDNNIGKSILRAKRSSGCGTTNPLSLLFSLDADRVCQPTTRRIPTSRVANA